MEKHLNASGSTAKSVVRIAGSVPFLLTLHILFLAAYVLLIPAFEGADEPEHLRYIEALYNGEKIHPVDPSDPRRYGIEVYQPPLYYRMAALIARAFPVVYPDHIAINPDKNPKFPFLVHDRPGEIFPYDAVGKTLRLFRGLSLLFGVLSFLALARILRLVMPDNSVGSAIILLIAALWPNNLQVFSVVSNDAPAYFLSLCLILVFLQTLKSDAPSWKHGLSFGLIFGLGILTKMTILLTAAALTPVLAVDALLDRRRMIRYLKMLPSVLLPVAVLSGPYVISRTMWYGSPTGEGLHNILVPSVLHDAALPADVLLGAMARALPGRFLADLCWQGLTLPLASLLLFLFWCFLNLLLAFRVGLSAFKEQDREQILFGIWITSAFLLMFVTLYAVFYKYVHIQIRHVWNLWPVTLLAPYFLFRGLNQPNHIDKDRILSTILAGVMAILVLVNLSVVHSFTVMNESVQNVSRPDQDYFVFLDNFAQSRYKAAAYLDFSGIADVKACRYYAEKNDWENALYHARRAIDKNNYEGVSRLMCVIALRKLGRYEEALEVLNQRKEETHETRFLEIQLLVELGRSAEALKKINGFLPEAPPDIRTQLELIQQEMTSLLPANGRRSPGLGEN